MPPRHRTVQIPPCIPRLHKGQARIHERNTFLVVVLLVTIFLFAIPVFVIFRLRVSLCCIPFVSIVTLLRVVEVRRFPFPFQLIFERRIR